MEATRTRQARACATARVRALVRAGGVRVVPARRTTSRLRRAIPATIAALALCTACSGGDASTPPCAVSSVSISPTSLSLRVGEAAALAATPVAERCAGRDLVATWSSDDVAMASVSAAGVVTGAGGGITTVRATIRGAAASASVTVLPSVARVDVSPSTATIAAGDTLRLVATPRDAHGAMLSGRTIAWSSADPSLATVSPAGLVTAVAAGGPVTIAAASEGRSGSASITVAPPPRLQLSATSLAFSAIQGGGSLAAKTVLITNAGGGTLANLSAGPVVYGAGGSGWLQLSLPAGSAAPTSTLTLQPTIGALAPGQYIATVPVASPVAANSPLQVTVTLDVQASPVRVVAVSPAAFLLAVGSKQAMTATLRDATGAIVTGRAVTWSSSNPAVAAVDASTGLVTAASTGVASIVASVDGVSGNALATTGTASAYDGSWSGSAGSGRTISMTVSLGRIAALTINMGTPLGSPCALRYTAAPFTLVSSNAFSFATSGGTASASVSGTFLSAGSAQGSYGAVTFDQYLCPPNLLVSGTVAGGTWSAAKP